MCGRITLIDPDAELPLDEHGPSMPHFELTIPRWNLRPSEELLCVVEVDGQPRAVRLRWGFRAPHWTPGHPQPINARGETVRTNGLFRDAFSRRRAIVVADGFYEPRKSAGARAPKGRPFDQFAFARPDRAAFAIAAVWSARPDGDTVALITCAPNRVVGEIHDRMPVILSRPDVARWLSSRTSPAEAEALLVACPDADLERWQVSHRLNEIGVDDAACFAPAGEG